MNEYIEQNITMEEIIQNINRYAKANGDFNYSDPSLVAQVKSGISLFENKRNPIEKGLTKNTIETFQKYTLSTIKEK